MRLLLFVFVLMVFNAVGQKIQKDYYPSGKLKHEGKVLNDLPVGEQKYYYENGQIKEVSYYDSLGLWLGYKEWNQYGTLINIQDFQTRFKNYPVVDFSKIKWQKITDGVNIYKYNTLDSVPNRWCDTSFFTANYICYFEDGKMLDNSYAKSNPMYARIDYMIEGFKVGIKQLKPGEIALIKIAPEKAFGSKISGNVPANSTLIYQIELLSIK